MIRTLRRVVLRTGERLRVAALEAPAGRYAEAIRRFLGHKGQPWLTHVDLANRGEVDALRTTYTVGLLGGEIVGNVMIVGDRRVGILGHVFTRPDQRRKGICTVLMEAALAGFRDSGGLVLTLGTGYDSPPYHVYASFGFAPVEPRGGCMILQTRDDALDHIFAPSQAHPRDLRWEHWAGVSLLYMLPQGDLLRCHAYGTCGPVGFEGSFLHFQTRRQRLDARARVLVTRRGSVAGVVLCQRDGRWPGRIYTLDLTVHPAFAHDAPRLLRSLPLPQDAKIQALIDRPSATRAAALSERGFRLEATLRRQLVRGATIRDVLVYALIT